MNKHYCAFIVVITLTIAGGVCAAHAPELRAGIITCDLPGHSPALIGALTEELTKQQYEVANIPIEQLFEGDGLTVNAPDLLVLPNASIVPTRAVPAIERYLRTGGDLIALRTPLSLRAPVRINGTWVNKDEYLTSQATTLPPHVLFDLSNGLKGWTRLSNHTERPITVEPITSEPALGQHAAHIKLSDLGGWDTHQAPVIAPPFPPGHTFTILAAKGSALTQSLYVEWEEKDGSRWIAVVALTKSWKRCVLAPSDFKFWPSHRSRGHKDDKFNPANAAVLRIGLAHSHTGLVDGPQDYWLGPIGTASRTSELESLADDVTLPALDTLCPAYKLFDCHDVVSLVQDPSFKLSPPLENTGFPIVNVVRSPHPRAGAGGFNKARAWRFQPLVQAKTADGQWRGNPATLMVHAEGPYKGGMWASFGIDDEAWYSSPPVRQLLAKIVERMRCRMAILDGGTDKYTYFEDQSIRFGARIANLAKQPMDAVLHVRLIDNDRNQTVCEKTWPATLKAGEIATYADNYTVEKWPAAGFHCEATLERDNHKSDYVANEAHVWRPKSEKHFVTVQDGKFVLDGKRWRPHGINYMPSSGIAVEDWDYFSNWTSSQAYDPVVIDRDLRKIKELGYNAVSVFTFHDHIACQNAVDLLRRCDNLGLKANVSLRPVTVMDFPWTVVKEMIERLQLAENDTLFAYDLDWEPLFGIHDDRAKWDRHWESWIVERYGSIVNAEKDWEFVAPRDAAGKLTNPLHDHIVKDGPWRRMVAGYRRFLDGLVYQKYSAARRLVRSIDRNHLVSFRMSEAGDPTCRWSDIIPYDFPYLAHAVDFLGPEAYGRHGDWEKIKPGWFEREYARWADPAKPMIWAEMGLHTWDVKLSCNSPELLSRQAAFYRDFYRMMIASSADGIFSWWFPGGFRYGENSDYGIINPDGSDRPATKIIREMGRQFIDGPDLKPVDTWIEFDRDASAMGIVGAYEKVQDAFWKAIAGKHTPGLRTDGTGTDSSNCPLLAIGNTPLNGTNPHKYLDAAFDLVEIKAGDAGQWLPVTKGGKIAVAKNTNIFIRAGITNLGEAAWLPTEKTTASPRNSGSVGLSAKFLHTALLAPLHQSVAHGTSMTHQLTGISVADSPVEIDLRMTIVSHGEFGERFKFTMTPK